MAHSAKKLEPTTDEVFRTPLGRVLAAAREDFLRSGEPMLGWEDLETEMIERRGEKTGDKPRDN